MVVLAVLVDPAQVVPLVFSHPQTLNRMDCQALLMQLVVKVALAVQEVTAAPVALAARVPTVSPTRLP